MIGIPKSLFYYLYGRKWELFFKELNIKYVLSPDTNKDILKMGEDISSDEMCLSLKIYLGHIIYLKDKCDYILVPRINNFGINDQMCTNFTSLYDIASNILPNIITYNIDYLNGDTEEKAFIKLGKMFGKTKKETKKAYRVVNNILKRLNNIEINNNLLKLNSPKIKLLLISHPYNSYDNYIGSPIIKLLAKEDVEIIDANLFDKEKASALSVNYSKTLYWKYSKELIGSVDMANVDGIVFLSTFPCGLDSLVNELVMLKINKPYLNIIIDDMSSLSGFETRIESFIDLVKERIKI